MRIWGGGGDIPKATLACIEININTVHKVIYKKQN